MSGTETAQPLKRYQLAAPYAQIRVPNDYIRFGIRTPAWVARGFKQNCIFREDGIHPDDLRHLLQATFEVRELVRDKFGWPNVVKTQQPMLVELPAS